MTSSGKQPKFCKTIQQHRHIAQGIEKLYLSIPRTRKRNFKESVKEGSKKSSGKRTLNSVYDVTKNLS